MRTHELLKRPTALLPLAMSAAAILTIVAHIARHGTAPQADEGAAAHLWQLLMALQVPALGFFAIKSFPEAPRQTAAVLAMQVAAILAALLPVALLGW
jgi:hypothetical protein